MDAAATTTTTRRPRRLRQVELPREPAKTGGGLSPALTTAVIAVVQAAAIAGFGFWLSGKLDLAIKERTATVSNVAAMSTLVNGMYDEKLADNDRLRIVHHLAMYGSEAIGPLWIMAATRNPFPPSAPLSGLRLLAVQHRAAVCDVLRQAETVSQAVEDVRMKAIRQLRTDLNC